MKAFKLKPAGTGSTSKSHNSHSQSISSSTSSTASSISTSIVSSSLSHAKHATSAAWSVCKQGTRTTLKLGSSALHLGQSSSTRARAKLDKLDWNQGQPRTYQQSRRVRRLFRVSGPSSSARSKYHSLGEDSGVDDDDRDIFSDRPFRESMQVRHHPKDGGHYCDEYCDNQEYKGHESAQLARFVFMPQHAASSDLATSKARYMQFASDEGEGDDDEWWRD
ncbi:hypothetical protein SEUCBS139899_004005 [Sporothrix eucalyptigena]|uniref:Uncharacterized protein n=1 Tax=Sporothrix eucalyptigena TaxID=1812306 RepID=A0ABP0AK91_9PEZI